MRSAYLLLPMMLAMTCGPADAQTLEEMSRCRAIADESRRLACYDAIELAPVSRLSKYEPVELSELEEYSLTYRGRFVEVVGWVAPQRDHLVLGSDAADAAAMPVEIEALPRRRRDDLLEQCGTGCEATVRGRVAPVRFTTGIVADDVIVR
jgi:hypothetical protein